MTVSGYHIPDRSLFLGELLGGITVLAFSGQAEAERCISGITSDSRCVHTASLFVAIRGYCTDGHRFIQQAVAQGAGVVVCEEFPPVMDSSCVYIKVADARKALAEAARIFYGRVSDRLLIIGVTGTNGKTTTARLITGMLNANGITAGYIGTNLCRIGEQNIPLERTTPEAHELHELFFLMAEAGCKAAVMEVSSHALALQRVHALCFQAAVFTNLTMEHLDFHHSMDEYAAAKQLLFDQLAPGGFAVVNSDDPFAAQMVSRLDPQQIYGCTLQPGSPSLIDGCHQFEANILAATLAASTVSLHFPESVITVPITLPGRFNVMNVLEAAAVGSALGLSPEEICSSLSSISSVSGRMERVGEGSEGYDVFVDYAHTPDALLKVLETLHNLKQKDSRLIVLFGCGGNRDRSKRPEMGRIAANIADEVILTSDNPRDEAPEAILDEIEHGITSGNYIRIVDRAEAIRYAVSLLKQGDILLVAGKGHEQYQEIAGHKYPFSDQNLLKESMNSRAVYRANVEVTQ